MFKTLTASLHRRWPLAALLAAALTLAAALAPVPGISEATDGTAGQGNRTLAVSGRAILDVEPDTAQVTLGVTELAETAALAYQRTAGAASELVGALKAQGLAEDEIQTTNLSLQAEYEWTRDERRLVGYRGRTSVVLTTHDLDRLGPIIDAAVAAGANEVGNIRFLVKDTGAHLDAALKAAVADARHKATLVAEQLDAQVGEALTVQVLDQGSPPVGILRDRMMAEAAPAADGAAPMPVLSGTVQYQAQVQVTFALK